MIVLERHRFLVLRIDVSVGQSYIPFEIQLPANVVKVNALCITNTARMAADDTLGILCLQSQDMCDTFYIQEQPYGILPVDLTAWEDDVPFIMKRKVSFLDINIPGDTGIITGWFRNANPWATFSIRIYLQYLETDKLKEDYE